MSAVLVLATGVAPTAGDLAALRACDAEIVVCVVHPAPGLWVRALTRLRQSAKVRRARSFAWRQFKRGRRVLRRLQRELARLSIRMRPKPEAPSAASAGDGSDREPPLVTFASGLSGIALLRLRRAIANVERELDSHGKIDMLVSLDGQASTVAWHVARSRPGVIAVDGSEAAVRFLTGSLASSIDLGERAAILDAPESLYPALVERESRRRRIVVLAPDLTEADLRAVSDSRADADVVGLRAGSMHGVALLAGASAVMVTTTIEDVVGEGRPSALRVLGADEVLDSGRIVTAAAVQSAVAPSGGSQHLLIGPANYAGQGAAWARALEQRTGVTARNLTVVSPQASFMFPADIPMTYTDWADPVVRARAAVEAVLPSTHVLLEALRPLLGLGDSGASTAWDLQAGAREIAHLVLSGRRVGLVLHGSEARRPREHVALYPMSPFANSGHEDETQARTTQTDNVHALMETLDVTRFVSTPDMLDFVPGAVWLPIVVGPTSFIPGRELFSRPRPVVMHAPSSGPLKGSDHIDPVLEKLDARGVIEYRRLQDIPPSLLPSYLRDTDILVDQVVLGNPGVLAAQAMACGRVVVAHLSGAVRARFGSTVPVVEATPSTLREVILGLVAEEDASRAVGAAGPAFVREHHDGRRSAAVLFDFVRGE